MTKDIFKLNFSNRVNNDKICDNDFEPYAIDFELHV